MNVNTKHNIHGDRSQAIYNAIINAYTLLVVEQVPEVAEFKPSTICIIDDEFVCVSEYDIDASLATHLECIAKTI